MRLGLVAPAHHLPQAATGATQSGKRYEFRFYHGPRLANWRDFRERQPRGPIFDPGQLYWPSALITEVLAASLRLDLWSPVLRIRRHRHALFFAEAVSSLRRIAYQQLPRAAWPAHN
jgi:hypothetical protein